MNGTSVEEGVRVVSLSKSEESSFAVCTDGVEAVECSTEDVLSVEKSTS